MELKLDKSSVSRAMLDITRDLCPVTFVKSRLFIEKQQPGDTIEIRLSAGEPLDNLPEALTLDGHQVLSLGAIDNSANTYQLILKIGEGT